LTGNTRDPTMKWQRHTYHCLTVNQSGTTTLLLGSGAPAAAAAAGAGAGAVPGAIRGGATPGGPAITGVVCVRICVCMD